MKKVFLAWSSENKYLAEKVGGFLLEYGFSAIVGGQNAKTMMVNNQIIEHMDDCEFAILIIEKKPDGTVSGNIMFEWGYLLHKLVEPNRIQAFLINMKSGELPTDVAGCWAAEKTKKITENQQEKELEFERLAKEICVDFIEHYNNFDDTTDKLSYIDNWESNKYHILNFNNERISEILLYGMQATIYSGQYENLLKKLHNILNTTPNLSQNLMYVIKCSCAVLDVFSSTKRLTKMLDDENYDRLVDNLEIPYENSISDEGLAEWCKIFRIDKLELCAEFYGSAQQNPQIKKAYLLKAVEYCHQVIALLDERVIKCPIDKNYATLYRAFANRNLSQIYKQLNELEPCEDYSAKIKQYCFETYQDRKSLYDHYLAERDRNCIAMDYITQEYILALTEQYRFETDVFKMMDIRRKIKKVYEKWSEENQVRNMIFDKIKLELDSSELLARE